MDARRNCFAGHLSPVFPDRLCLRPFERLNRHCGRAGAASPGDLDSANVALGSRLFRDPRLSGDGRVSCASCHDLQTSGADTAKFSRGARGALGDTNSPTVFNSALNFRQFWDGRAGSLEEQVSGPLLSPKEMVSSWTKVLTVVTADASYVKAFRESYATEPSATNLARSIAEFERSLVNLGAPFDRYLRGEEGKLTPQAMAGYEKFRSYGCVACHQGAGVGGNMYQAVGVVEDYFKLRGGSVASDAGRAAVTGRKEDLHVLKVPGLRNVARTAPYFHDGSAPDLASAVRTMARVQLGRKLSPRDTDEIVSFLESLTGKFPATVAGEVRRPAHAEVPPR